MSASEIKEILIKVSFNEDRDAFKSLYLYFYQDLFRLAKTFVKSPEGAEEIVDDAFLKLWINRAKLYEINNLKVYLFVCIKNLCINFLEKQKNIQIVSIEDLDLDPEDKCSSPGERLYVADLKGIISNAVAVLTPQCRLIFQLVKEDGLKYREVAEVLNISVKTVEYHIGNALKKISEQLTLLSKQ
jgi:RNA polymerase sigma-70 factor (family 1)